MGPGPFASLIAVGLLIGATLVIASLLRNARKRGYFARAEYWVYLPGAEMPDQTAMLDRILRANPYRQGSRMPITPGEAVLLSDVRLHIALALRTKNPHAFRPDLFDSHAEPTVQVLERLAESHSFVKLRYISEERLPDKRHLQFLIHAADAVAELGGGGVVYDAMQERLFTREELAQILSEHFDATEPQLHARAVWQPHPNGGVAQTRGLVKVGLPELVTEEMENDHQVLATGILEEAIEQLWEVPALPEALTVTCFEDLYRLEFELSRRGPVKVHILKLPAAYADEVADE